MGKTPVPGDDPAHWLISSPFQSRSFGRWDGMPWRAMLQRGRTCLLCLKKRWS